MSIVGNDAFGAQTTAFDRWMRESVQGRRAPHVDAVAAAISHAATPTILYGAAVLTALLLWWRRGWRAAAAVMVAATLAWALNNGAKELFDRMRPPGGADHESHSFPSGHATASAAVFVTSAFVLWREWLLPPAGAVLVGAVLPIMIAWSRVRIDEHWATDVLAGWCLGLVIAGACGLLHRVLVSGPAERHPRDRTWTGGESHS